MKLEIDLLKNYPRTNRDTKLRNLEKNEDIRNVARQFGKEFFDGERKFGYGGFNYNPKFWTKVVDDFISYWNLDNSSKVLDVGCAKGFMLYDLKQRLPGIHIKGIDISEYAIKNAKEEVKEYLEVGDAKKLNFESNSFDVVISINTIHNLDKEECKLALMEIERVSKKNSYITVDAYRNVEEKQRMFEWNLTAQTILSVSEWKNLFNECNYSGDYYWFIP